MTADEMYEQARGAMFANDKIERERLFQIAMDEEWSEDTDEDKTLLDGFARAQDEHVAAAYPSLRKDIGNLAVQEIDRDGEPSAAVILDRIFFGDPAPDA